MDPDVVVVADVRRGADQLDPVGLALSRHVDAVGEVLGAVVEPREEVAVEVNQR